MNGRGRHFEHTIWFLIINQVHHSISKNTYHLLKLRGILQRKPRKIIYYAVIHIVIILCLIEHLCYAQGPFEMFSNVFILMECYLKLGPDVDHSDFYLLCLMLSNWLPLLPNLIGIQKQKRSLNACIEFKN